MDTRKCVQGVDINPGGTPASKRPLYSVAIVCDDRVVEIVEEASLERVIRLAWEYKPFAIATDNPFELGKDYNALAKVVSLLPPGTRIIWVNWGEKGIEPLMALARAHGVKLEEKPSPSTTAIILAKLALKGVGKNIVSPSSMTKIIVARMKGHKKGGMSSNRFKRRARANILRVVKDIKRLLDKESLDYDLVYRKSGGGLDGALFNVYAPSDKLPSSIRMLSAENVRIIIQPVYKLELTTLESGYKPIIAGIDPGTTTGLAILDLEGNILYLASRKGLDRSWIIDTLNKHGKPVMVATDVNPVPDTVKKIASTFKARLYVPKEDVSVAIKREIVQKALSSNRASGIDSHERDALAAAILAYRDLSAKIRHVESYVEKLGLELPLSRLKTSIIEGMTLSEAVESVISEMMGDVLTESHSRLLIDRKNESDMVRRLKDRIDRLEWEKKYLEKKLRENEFKVHELEKRIERIVLSYKRRSEANDSYLRQVINSLSTEIRHLNEKLNYLAEERRKLLNILENLSMGFVIAVPVYNSIDHWSKESNLPDHGIIYVKDLSTYTSSSIKKAVKMGVKGILTSETSDSGAPRLLEREAIPVISLESLDLDCEFHGNIMVIDVGIKQLFTEKRARLEKEVIEKEKKALLGLIIEYKENRRKSLEKLSRENKGSTTIAKGVKTAWS